MEWNKIKDQTDEENAIRIECDDAMSASLLQAKQMFPILPHKDSRMPHLQQLAKKQHNKGQILIYTKFTRTANWGCTQLCYHHPDINIECTIGVEQQKQREKNMRAFKLGHIKVLVATMTILGRSVSIPNVRIVVLYDQPDDISQYRFCLGPITRKGNTGTSVMHLTEDAAPPGID